MTDNRGLGDTERLKKFARIQRHVVKIVRNDWLGGTAESDLVRHHHTEARLAKNFDWSTEVKAAKIHSVQQNNSAAIRLARGRDVHVGHANVLSIKRQWQEGHRIRIFNFLVGNAAGLDIRRSGRSSGLLRG